MGRLCVHQVQLARRAFLSLAALVLVCSGLAHASATLLLEEPYGKAGILHCHRPRRGLPVRRLRRNSRKTSTLLTRGNRCGDQPL